MIDPILSLAFSMHSNKGVYALLLGSGVSRSAGIPTGWEVVLDLVRKLAHMMNQKSEPDPAAWYKSTFGTDPDYAVLLDEVAKSAPERSQLIRSYFEPSVEQREQGLKVPTTAHRAIAELAASGYIRLIVTTNFDRLLEAALEDAGVVPTVISTPDSVEGALPLVHLRCCVIKIHGDYLDTRLKNTPGELAEYDPRMDTLLDRVLDEFGLIVCGWSAEWDTALRAALERCRTRRFTTFWTSRGKPGPTAQKLIALRAAQVIPIANADSFFGQLREKVMALQDLELPHPISAKVGVATIKRYLADDRHRIQLHDLLLQETAQVREAISQGEFAVEEAFSADELLRRVRSYEGLSDVLCALMLAGCYWGGSQHVSLWVDSLERIALPEPARGRTVWIGLRRYPALLLMYTGGLAALAANQYGTLAALLTKAQIRVRNNEMQAALALNTGTIMDKGVANQLPGMERHFVPLSDYLFDRLRQRFQELLPDDLRYQRCFDRFEYLLGLVHADLRDKAGRSAWGPIGCFGWRYRDSDPGTSIYDEIQAEAASAGSAWPPLTAGLFDGSVERFATAKAAFDQMVMSRNWY